ncbi:MAG: hypothetical protein HN644_13955 [Rhodospirillales bacterium]|jgi:hypothetical protein|nr:hypothetical protein [Rhodospirillales bacterium]MBT4038978.1 hypothetical protein [Rhodospirillales bacterium]MBT4626650.1 hypothetical protein [Rhodospirillales bacterium]MBT5351878.1 hypothetical protein [Rhodospirillales bacterium]MBT5520634.1 hypothetical protein [Rhodospirillales bacterium]
MTMTPEQIVNLDRYPISDLGSDACQTLIKQMNNDLDTRQYCVMPNFFTEAAVEISVQEALAKKPDGFANSSDRNCYLHKQGEPDLPDDHPRNTFFHASYTMMGAHLFNDASCIVQMYYWQPMIDFIAGVVGEPALYPNEDPLQPTNILAYSHGDNSAWHFDSENSFTMTLMLQAADEGGNFEISPNTRTDDEQHYDKVAKIVHGDRSTVQTVPREAGALVIFRGCNSLHRVTTVEGDKNRLMSVFVYEREPGVTGDPRVNETVYGRATV